MKGSEPFSPEKGTDQTEQTMLDDVRTHNPQPSDEERAWMSFDPLAAIGRTLVILVLAFAIGGYVSYALEVSHPTSVAKR